MNAAMIDTLSSHATVRDTDLGERLGMARPTDIRRLIEANRAELESYGGLHAVRANSSRTGGRPATAYHLNEVQALLLCGFARTPKGAEVRRAMIAAFKARRRDASAALTGGEDSAAAARAWADRYEAMRAALIPLASPGDHVRPLDQHPTNSPAILAM